MRRAKVEWVEVEAPEVPDPYRRGAAYRIYREGKNVRLIAVRMDTNTNVLTFNRKDLIAALREAGDLPRKTEGFLQ